MKCEHALIERLHRLGFCGFHTFCAFREEERSPKKKGDKRIADDIPPPADLTGT
jgi:IS5 family transposase